MTLRSTLRRTLAELLPVREAYAAEQFEFAAALRDWTDRAAAAIAAHGHPLASTLAMRHARVLAIERGDVPCGERERASRRNQRAALFAVMEESEAQVQAVLGPLARAADTHRAGARRALLLVEASRALEPFVDALLRGADVDAELLRAVARCPESSPIAQAMIVELGMAAAEEVLWEEAIAWVEATRRPAARGIDVGAATRPGAN